MKKSSHGFTIIELLVVIIVIGILATISVVVYNGIQDRAQAVRAATIADSYAKLLLLQYTNTGSLADTDSYDSTCLGTAQDYPAGNGFQAGECAYWGDGWGNRFKHTLQGNFGTALSNNGFTAPSAAIPLVSSTEANKHHDMAHYRGLIFSGDCEWTGSACNYSRGRIHYFLRGKQECPKGTAVIYDKITECIIAINPPDGFNSDDYAGRDGGEGS